MFFIEINMGLSEYSSFFEAAEQAHFAGLVRGAMWRAVATYKTVDGKWERTEHKKQGLETS